MYTQKVVWIGTILGDTQTEEFEKFFLDMGNFHVKYEEEFQMIGEYDGIHCILFSLCEKDIPKFAMFRLSTNDMKWFEDWVDNHTEAIPIEVLNKYKDYLNC